jgi:3-phenylpropionate/cinnamic acid dioxygenase small subunit
VVTQTTEGTQEGTAVSQTDLRPVTGERVRAGEPLHHEIVEFLEDEATLLDHSRLLDWLQLLAPDLVYRMPVRVTRMRDDVESEFSDGMFHFDENATTIFVKVTRMATTASPWAENPVSRTRRFITNVRVHRTDKDNEFAVTSSILLVRSRYDEDKLGLLSAERNDIIRRTDDGLRLVSRDILADQATLGLANLAVFL